MRIISFMNGVAVVGAVIFRDGKILAAKRSKGKTLAGFWEFPGGKVELGESPTEALSREVREELDAEVEVVREIVTAVHEYDFATIELTTFQCKLKGEQVTNKEHEELKWIPVKELDAEEWAPADSSTINWIMSNLT